MVRGVPNNVESDDAAQNSTSVQPEVKAEPEFVCGKSYEIEWDRSHDKFVAYVASVSDDIIAGVILDDGTIDGYFCLDEDEVTDSTEFGDDSFTVRSTRDAIASDPVINSLQGVRSIDDFLRCFRADIIGVYGYRYGSTSCLCGYISELTDTGATFDSISPQATLEGPDEAFAFEFNQMAKVFTRDDYLNSLSRLLDVAPIVDPTP